MSVNLDNNAFRKSILGLGPVSKATGTLAATTVALFTVATGRVMITAMWGLVTVDITVANSYKLQFNPTAGDTADLVTAVDIGTSDTLTGDILSVGLATTTAPAKLMSGKVGYGTGLLGAVIPVGQIEHVSAGTDGAITWYATWVPLDDGATFVAA